MTEELLNILAVALALIFAISVLFWARKQTRKINEEREKFKSDYTEQGVELLAKIKIEQNKLNKHKDCKKCSVCINKEFE